VISCCVESTVRYDKPVSACRTQLKPRGDFTGWNEMVGMVIMDCVVQP